MVIETVTPGLMMLAALGGGAAVLRALGLDSDLPPIARLTMSAVLGIGVMGWLVFFLGWAGWLAEWQLVALQLAMLPGLLFLRVLPRHFQWAPLNPVEVVVVVLIIAVMAMDVLEGLSPPADADTLAYHFATPKAFLELGELNFIPRAGDGAIPMLLQMTYMAALGIGGEGAVTLWTMVSGWMVAALVYALATMFVDRSWALCAALLFLTTPTVIYGAGSGQVEVRNAGFVLIAAAAIGFATQKNGLRYVALAGLAAGFFVASKYTGLLFAFSCGLVAIVQRRWLVHGIVFSIALLAAGAQWYVWNWAHIGDPVFPMLFGVLDYRSDLLWNAEIHQYYFTKTQNFERLYPTNPLGWLLFPTVESVAPSLKLESFRLGFGVFWVLALPLAVVCYQNAAWRRDNAVMTRMLIIVAIAYTLWFTLGPSQRLRHLFPLYPVLLLLGVAAFHHTVSAGTISARSGGLVLALVLSLQVGMQSVYSLKFARWMASGASRDAILAQSINRYAMVKWMNANLSGGAKVFNPFRETIYLMDVPTFYAHTDVQTQIDIRTVNRNAERFWRQLRTQGITHVFDGETPTLPEGTAGLPHLKHTLEVGNCLKTIHRTENRLILSRTLGETTDGPTLVSIVAALQPETCIYEKG